jgi:uncharacterized membrane protein
MPEIVNMLMRWLHLSSMAALMGGSLYARWIAIPASAALSPDAREAMNDRAARRARPVVLAAMAGLLLSGAYTLAVMPGHSPRYHALLGIKLLLVAHVFAVAVLVTRPGNPRRARLLNGTLISAAAIVMIAVYLHRIF